MSTSGLPRIRERWSHCSESSKGPLWDGELDRGKERGEGWRARQADGTRAGQRGREWERVTEGCRARQRTDAQAAGWREVKRDGARRGRGMDSRGDG